MSPRISIESFIDPIQAARPASKVWCGVLKTALGFGKCPSNSRHFALRKFHIGATLDIIHKLSWTCCAGGSAFPLFLKPIPRLRGLR